MSERKKEGKERGSGSRIKYPKVTPFSHSSRSLIVIGEFASHPIDRNVREVRSALGRKGQRGGRGKRPDWTATGRQDHDNSKRDPFELGSHDLVMQQQEDEDLRCKT